MKIGFLRFCLAVIALSIVAGIVHAADNWRQGIAGGQVIIRRSIDLGATGHMPMIAIGDASGKQITAFGGSGGTASNFGSAFPTAGTAVGFTDGTNMVGGTVDVSGNLKVNCATGCAGGTFNINADDVATAADSGKTAAFGYVFDGTTWDRLRGDSTNGLFANIKTSVLPTGAATSAAQTTAQTSFGNIDSATSRLTSSATNIAPGSALATTSFMIGARYKATPPTFTDGQEGGLQIDSAGRLIVSIGAGGGSGGTSSNFGSAFPTPGTAVGFTDGTNMVAGRVGAVANLAAATNFVNALGICQYLAAAPTLTDTRFNQVQCDINGNIKVNVVNANANGQAVMASSSPVVIASNQSAVPVTLTSTTITGTVAATQSGTWNVGTVTAVTAITNALPAGTNLLGKAGIDQTTPGTTNGVQLMAGGTGGCTGGTAVSAASTNATNIKASAGTLCELDIQNPSTTLYYLSFYNVAGTPTCNSDTIVRQQIIPPASAAGQVGGLAISLGAYGQAFTTGIAFCITAAAAGTGNAATDIRLNYTFK